MPAKTPPLIVPDVARMAGCSVMSVRRAIKAGTLACCRDGYFRLAVTEPDAVAWAVDWRLRHGGKRDA
jgi:hypothetical protein